MDETARAMQVSETGWKVSVLALLAVLTVAAIFSALGNYARWVQAEQHEIRLRKLEGRVSLIEAESTHGAKLDTIIELLGGDDARTTMQGRGMLQEGVSGAGDPSELQQRDD